MFSWTIQISHNVRRSSSHPVLRLSERHYRAESTTVINGVTPDETRAKVSSTRQDDVTRVKSLTDIPGPEGLRALPFLGTMFLFYPFTKFIPEKSHLMFEELYRKYGPMVKFRKGLRWSVLLFDPDLIEQAMTHEGQHPIRPSPPLLDAYTNRTGKKKGFSQIQGEEWMQLRRPVQEFLLQPANLGHYTPVLDDVARELTCHIAKCRQPDGRVHLESLMLPYAIESSGVYCINTRLGLLQEHTSAGSAHSASPHSDSQSCQHHQHHRPHQHHQHHPHTNHPQQQDYQQETTRTTCPFATFDSSNNSNNNSSSSNLATSPSLSSSSPSTSSLTSAAPSPSSAPFRQLTDEERLKLQHSIKVYMNSIGSGYYTFPTYKLFRTKLYNQFEEASNYLAQVIQARLIELVTIINESKASSSGDNGRPNLLKSLLLDGRLDVRICTSMVTGFFSTATDNISNSLGNVLWYLAKHPSKQAKLREEIDQCIPHGQQVTGHMLSHMPYLKACLKESHRLTFPTPLGSVRVMPEDMVLGGYHIPAGTSVNFGHNVLGHSAKYFEKPELYLPERWLKPTNVLTSDLALRRQQSIITMAFGFGKRNCVGRRLAEQQIYLALIRILQYFELRLGNPEEELDVVYKITASSSKPMDIRFHPLTEIQP